jgi:hypothetical protein
VLSPHHARRTSRLRRRTAHHRTRSNPTKRAVYDLYGHEGLRAGLEVGPRLKSREEIRAEFEALKAARDARAAEARVNYRGSYMFGACGLTHSWLAAAGTACTRKSRRVGLVLTTPCLMCV